MDLNEHLRQMEEALSINVCFHDYHQHFVKKFEKKYFNHNNPFCTLIKEQYLKTCMDLESGLCLKHPSHMNQGYWKLCHANIWEYYLPICQPFTKVSIGAIYIGCFSDIPKKIGNELIQKKTAALPETIYELETITDKRKDQIESFAFFLRNTLELYLKENMGEIHQIDRKEKIFYFISEHLKEGVTLDHLSQYLNISYPRASQLVKELFDCTFPELLFQLRLEKAEKLLLFSKLSVKNIAEECGFKEPEYFYKRFKSQHRMTPLQYRKNKIDSKYI